MSEWPGSVQSQRVTVSWHLQPISIQNILYQIFSFPQSRVPKSLEYTLKTLPVIVLTKKETIQTNKQGS